MNRIDNLRKKAANEGKPANQLIFSQQNITYLTDFSGATALLIPQQGEATLYVAGVNYEQAKVEAKNADVELLKRGENLMEKIAKKAPSQRFAVDSLGIEGWRSLAKAVGGEENLEPAGNLLRELRRVKDQREIQLIREACRIADIGMQRAVENIHPGVKEKEVAAEAEYAMRKAGSDGTAFDTIVASGYCCAYPHGTFQDKTIEEGDFVVVDLGAIHRYYRSDLTRTFIAGPPTKKQIQIYQTIKQAQQKAIEVIKPGVPAKEVDAAARQVIEESEFCDFFVHNLGHGVGLEIHEAPILSPDSKDVLEVGNVVTVEPGIYVPGFGGVRVEDTVLVTEHGAEKLTNAPCVLR